MFLRFLVVGIKGQEKLTQAAHSREGRLYYYNYYYYYYDTTGAHSQVGRYLYRRNYYRRSSLPGGETILLLRQNTTGDGYYQAKLY